MKVGMQFEAEKTALELIDQWSKLTRCPLTKQMYRKPGGVDKNGTRIKGQRVLKCFHGVERKSKSASIRPY